MSGVEQVDRPFVLVVDDSRLYREGLVSLLTKSSGLGSVQGVADLEAADKSGPPPDVVLLNMASHDALGRLSRLSGQYPRAAVVVIGVDGSEDEVLACAEAGAAGYLVRSDSFDRLVTLIRSVLAGETLAAPSITRALMRRVGSLAAVRGPRVPVLTAREDQILALVEAGLSNQEIADRLGIELRTAKNHLHNIFAKLGVRRRGEAVAVVRAARLTSLTGELETPAPTSAGPLPEPRRRVGLDAVTRPIPRLRTSTR